MAASIINDRNYHKFQNVVIGGELKGRGLKPRDWQAYPPGCFAWAEPFPDAMLIPDDEINSRIEYQKEQKASLLDLREANYDALKSLDQDSLGLCWAFSSTKAMMYLRAIMGEPALPLSAWWVAGEVKGWRDEGGWGGESLEQIVSAGAPVLNYCPKYDKSYDTAECKDNAKLHKCTEWWEGSTDPDKAMHQMFSAWLWGLPCICDYNFLSHSMCGIAAEAYRPTPKVVMDNSWGEKAGDKGLYRIQGLKCQPNGLWIPRVQTPSPR